MRQRSAIRILTALLLTAAIVAPATAAIHYKARTVAQAEGGAEGMDMYVEGWVNGPKAKVLFLDSGNPWMKSGQYLSTLDGGQTLYLVDPEKETYSVWDLDAILQFAGSMMQSLGPLMQFEIAEPDVELLVDEDGGEMLGLSTRHYRFKTVYDMQMKILGMKRSNRSESVHDIWTTNELDDVALGVWLRKDPPETGHPELDKLRGGAWSQIEGVPLKMVEESTTTMGKKKGKSQSSRTEFTVEALDTAAADPAGGYGYPEHYQRVEMMPSMEDLAGRQEGDDKKNPLGGLFGDGR